MNDIFPPFHRRDTGSRRAAPLMLPIDTFSRDARFALVVLITGAATMTAGGWAIGASVIPLSAMQELVTDQMVRLGLSDTRERTVVATLTPRGRMYASACLNARARMDVFSAPITPPQAG